MQATRERGSAGVEFGLVTLLVAAVLSTLAIVYKTSSRQTRKALEPRPLEALAGRVLDALAADLRSSAGDSIYPRPREPFYTAKINFETFPTNAEAPWELVKIKPVRSSSGALTSYDLIRIESPGSAEKQEFLLCHSVSKLLQGEAENGRDDNGNGLIDEPGFCAVFEQDTVTLYLTLEQRGTQGRKEQFTNVRRVAIRKRWSDAAEQRKP